VTTSTDTAGHPDVTEISDLAEGLLPPSRTAEVRRHLAACELCADVLASLDEIRSLLGTLPSPSPMPVDVAERIDAALAAEVLLSSRPPVAADITASADMSPAGSGTDHDPRVSRETSTPTDRPSGRVPASTTGPGRKGSKGRKERERRPGGRRRVAVLTAALSAAALGLGAVLVSTLTGSEPAGPGHQEQATSAAAFTRHNLKAQVSELLDDGERRGDRRSPASEGESPLGNDDARVFRQTSVPVPDCVRKGIGRADGALATDNGTYEGTTALLVVLPDATDASRITAYVVDATCVTDSSSAPAEVLLTQSYDRP
jgi:anti-sigma factor RsiW